MTTEQINWQEKQPSRVDCVSEDPKCWGAWDTTCGHKAKDTTPSITWRRKAWGIEEAARRSSFKGRKRAVVNEKNIGTVLRVTMGKLKFWGGRRGVERIWAFQSGLLDWYQSDDLELPNWTELWHSCGAPRQRSLLLFSCLVPNSVQRSEDWRGIFISVYSVTDSSVAALLPFSVFSVCIHWLIINFSI